VETTMTKTMTAAMVLLTLLATGCGSGNSGNAGGVVVTTTKDAITGASTTSVVTQNKGATLGFGCAKQSIGGHEVGDIVVIPVMAWSKYLRGQSMRIEMRYRFSSDTDATVASRGASSSWWMTESHTLATGDPYFVARAVKNESVLFQIVDVDGDRLTYTFPLKGLREALTKLDCPIEALAS
jgi:hypothetical protein